MIKLTTASLFLFSLSACAPEVPIDLKSGLYSVKLGYSNATDICMGNIVPGDLKDAVDVFATKSMGHGDDSAACEFTEFSRNINRFTGALVCKNGGMNHHYTTIGSISENEIKIDGKMRLASADEIATAETADSNIGTSYGVHGTYKGNCG